MTDEYELSKIVYFEVKKQRQLRFNDSDISSKIDPDDIIALSIDEKTITEQGKIIGLKEWKGHKAIVIILPYVAFSKKDIEERDKLRTVTGIKNEDELFQKLKELKIIHPKEVMKQIKCDNPKCPIYNNYSSKGRPLLTLDASVGEKRKWVHFKCGGWTKKDFSKKGLHVFVWDEKRKKLVAPNVKGCGHKLSFFEEKVQLD